MTHRTTMLLAILAAATLTTTGCDSGDKPTTGTDTAKPAAADTAKPAASGGPTTEANAKPIELTDEEVAVPEDFIEDATKDITKDSYKDKLAELQKEIDGDE